MKKIFIRDNLLFGLILGAITPLILLGILTILNNFIGTFHYHVNFIQQSTLYLLAIIANVLYIRYYMSKLKFDKTGRGVLLITFLYILAFAVNEFFIQ